MTLRCPASAAASSAYLSASELFPLEMRGFVAPLLFGALVASGSVAAVAGGYVLGAVLVIAAGALAWRYGVDAERKPLEEIAPALD